MSVITISRQMGAQGLAVSKKIAEALGYNLYWREIINQAASQAGSPEMALAVIDELGLLDICPSPKDCEAYHHAVRIIIEDYASAGNAVILGRAGQVILRSWPGVFHVRLFAPPDYRAQQIANKQHIPLKAALARISTSDQYRTKYLQQFYDTDWNDPYLYDLILNITDLDIQDITEIILYAYQIKMGVELPIKDLSI